MGVIPYKPAHLVTVGREPAVAERSVAGHQRPQNLAVGPPSPEAIRQIRARLVEHGKKPGRIVQLHGRYQLIEAEL